MDPLDELVEAVCARDVERSRAWLKAGVDPNLVCESGGSPLYWAAVKGDLRVLRLLIEHGGRVHPGEGSDRLGLVVNTSMHVAAEAGRGDVLRLLLTSGGGEAALNVFDHITRTPMMCAVDRKHRDVAWVLIQTGADVNAREDARAGDTALHVAARNGDVGMVEMLLEAGADPSLTGWMALTPAHVAEGEVGTIRKLLARAASK
jgi:ankyrin repeat protein